MTTNSKRCQKSWSMSDTSVTTLQPHQARGLYQSGSGGEYSAAADGPDSETRGFTANQLAHLAEWTELTSFRDGIFDCFENLSPSCIWATFLSCCLIGQITEKLNVFSCKVVTSVLVLLAVLGNIPSLAFTQSIFYFSFISLLFYLRMKVRSRFHDSNSSCGDFSRNPGDVDDCCLSFWCSCCALAQLARHIYNYKLRGSACGRFTTNGDFVDSQMI